MQDLKITLAQVEQAWEDKSRNLAHFTEVFSRCGDTDLILLPEMFHTGFSMNAAELAEETEGSVALDWLRTTSAEKNAAIYTSYIAVENGRFFNRGVFAEPDGKLTFYDKRRRFAMAGEHEIFSQGEQPVIVLYRNWKINLQICYDLRFPEISRNRLGSDGLPLYDVCLYVANWPERRISHWNTLLPARAVENQCYVAAVNRVGKDANDLDYNGDSGVWNLLGEKVAGALPEREELVSVSLRYDEMAGWRAKLPFLKDNL